MDEPSSAGQATRKSLEQDRKVTESIADQDTTREQAPQLRRLAAWRGIRVLAWDGDILYASRGYELVRLLSVSLQRPNDTEWEPVASFSPVWWRNFTSRYRLTYRLVRDGFHALAVLDDKTMIAAVPSAIVTRQAESREFCPTHKLLRGTRPLHITAVPDGNIYWGEYFDNRARDEVHIYGSADRGQTWHVALRQSADPSRRRHPYTTRTLSVD